MRKMSNQANVTGTNFKKMLALAAMTAITGLCGQNAQAAIQTWDSDANGANGATAGSGTWNATNTNWYPGTGTTDAIFAAANTAAFGGADTGGTVTLGAPTTALNLAFLNSNYTLSAASSTTLTLTINNSTASTIPGPTTVAVWVAANKTATIGNNIVANLTATSFGQAIGLDNGGILNIDTGAIIDKTAGANRDTAFRVAAGGTGTINVSGTIRRTVAADVGQIAFGSGLNTATSGTVNVNVNNGGLITTAGTGSSNGNGSITLGNQNGFTANMVINSGGTVTATDAVIADAQAGIKIGAVTGSIGTLTLNTGGSLIVQKVFAGTGTSTFNFNGGTLKPIVSTTNFMNGIGTANVQSGGALIDTNSFNVTVGQALLDGTGGGGLTKSGAGTLTLSNNGHTYTGATNVTNGTLAYSATSGTATSNATTISGGAGLSLRVNSDLTTTRLSTNNGNLTFGTGATALTVDFGSLATPTGSTLISTGTGGLTMIGTTTLSLLNTANLSTGTFALIDYDGTTLPNLSGFAATSYPLAGHAIATLINNTGNKSVDLQVSAAPIYWQGAFGTNWDIAGANNWLINGVTQTQYLEPTAPGDAVIFDDSAAGVGPIAVNVTTNVSPITATFNNVGRNYTFSGSFGIAGTTGLTKNGAATVTLNNPNSYTGATNINEGELVIGTGGSINGANTANIGLITVGTTNGLTGTLTVNNGTVNATKTSRPSFIAGSTAGSIGVVNLSGTGVINSTNEFWLGNGAASTSTMNMTGGALNSGTWIVVGFAGDTATFNQSAGITTVATNRMTIGAAAAANGTYNLSGTGSFVASSGTGGIYVGESGNGTINMSGTSTIDVANIQLGRNAGAQGFVYLNGGTLTAGSVTGGTGSSLFAFNGGTLKAKSASAGLVTGLTVLQVQTGGANVDTNGFDVTFGQSMSEDGALPGGGFNKSGAGTLTLNVGNSFTGATNITAGALRLDASGDVNSSSAINISGGKLVQTSGTAVNPNITLSAGAIDGTGTVNAINITGTSANTVIANGNGTSNTALNTGNLTFGAGGSSFALRIPGGATTNAVGVNVNGTITTGGAGTIKVDITPSVSLVSGTMYDLIGVNGGSPTISAFALGNTFTTREAGSTFVWDSINNAVALNYVGDSVKWSGAGNNAWALGLVNNNWKLNTAGTPTNFIAGDKIVFDDSATGSTSLDITTTNVSPTSVTFKNNTKNYTIGSTGGFGIAGTTGVTKSGTGTATFTSANTYTGATTVNSGSLKVDFSAATPASNLISASSALSLNGGNLSVVGKANTSNSQTVASTTLNLGGSSVTVTDDVTANSTVLNLGAISRAAGGALTVNIPAGTQSSTNGVTTTRANEASGITAPWAVVNNAGAYSYATNSANNLVPYTGATAIANMSGTFVATSNYDVGLGNVAATTDNRGVSPSLNTARILSNFAVNYNANAAATNFSNGYMTIGTGTLTLGGAGNVGIGTSSELVLAAYGAPIVVTAPVINNGANTSRVVAIGTNTVTLSGINTFTGATVVDGGTLIIGGAGTVNTSSGVQINGAGARFVYNSSAALTPAVNVTQGTLDGTGTIGDVTVADSRGGIVSNGSGATLPLTMNNLTFNGAASINPNVSGGNAGVVVNGTLTTTAANGKIVINPSGSFITGNNNLVSYGSFGGLLSDFTLGTITGMSPRASGGSLVSNGNNIALSVGSIDTIVWSGAAGPDGTWSTDTTGNNAGTNHWTLSTAHTATNFWANDDVAFNDTYQIGASVLAPTTTTVNITGANVNPASTTFNNSTLNYTIGSTGGFGIAGTGPLTKNGTGTATLTGAHTYSGLTIINAGTLQIGDGTTDGTIASTAVSNNANLTFNVAGTQTYSGAISGTGAVAKSGTGSLTLNTAHTYQGGTNVSAGALTINAAGNLGTGNINVATGATLNINNNQTITGSVAVSGGGSIINTGSFANTGDFTGFTGTFTHNSTTVSTAFNSATSTSKNAAYILASVQGGSQGMVAAGSGDYTLEMGSLTGVANSLVRGGNTATGTTTLQIGNLNTNTTFDGSINNGVTKIIALTKVGTGTLTLTGGHTYTGATAVNGGKLVVSNAIQNGAVLSVSNAGTLDIPVNGAVAGVTSVGDLTITGTNSRIDLHDNDLVVNYSTNPSSYSTIVNQVKSGLALLGGADADSNSVGDTGIGSTEVDLQTIGGTVLAVVDDGDPNIAGGITSLSGFTIPNPTTSVLVKYTWFGDANLDGIVDGSDYALTDTGFTSGGLLGGWVFGDYDYSGTVDGGDYALQDTGFIAQTGALPEPTTLGLLGLGAVGVLRRRRKA